jgi:four helix bundle protein
MIEKKNYLQSAKQLEVYKLAYAISLKIHKASLEFPKIEQYALADQMRRASKSICANLAEGFGKQLYSPAEFMRFISMAIGSSCEMQVWIDYSYDLGYIDGKRYADWEETYNIITKMLNRLRLKRKEL